MTETRKKHRTIILFLLFCSFIFTAYFSIGFAVENIKSNPLFLLWKAWEYMFHKIFLGEHLFPQKCIMTPYNTNLKSSLSYSIVQVFHLEASIDSWQGLSAAICSIYAEKHGYGYVYAHVTPVYHNKSTTPKIKRTMHWSRIPVLLWLLDHNPSVNWWLYLDMDAMINPLTLTFPISWILSSIHHDNGCVISRSSAHTHPDLLFFSNANQEPHMPCSGSFLASNTSGKSLALWWNYPGDPYFDYNSEYDQHRVHELMYFEPEQFNFAVLDIRGFDFKPSSYLLHYSGQRLISTETFRHRIFRSIQKSKAISSIELDNAIERIRNQKTIKCIIDLGLTLYHQHDRRILCGYDHEV
jgi:hypothetical protein